jgi:hypothetical protein
VHAGPGARPAVVAWWVWTAVAAGLRARCYTPASGLCEIPAVSSVGRIGRLIGERLGEAVAVSDTRHGPPAGVLLVLEEQFVSTAGKATQADVMACARSAGAIEDGLRDATPSGAVAGPLRPLASVWRRQVLGLDPRTSADRAEAAAVAAVPGLLSWPTAPGLPSPFARGVHMLTQQELGALAEAACMGLWGHQQQRQHATPEARHA